MAAIAVAAGGMMMICCSSSMALLVMGGDGDDTTTTPTIPTPNPEVFHIGGYTYTKAQAEAGCVEYGSTLATDAQLTAAYDAGANWCSSGWLSDTDLGAYPITEEKNFVEGCGGISAGIRRWNSATDQGGLAGLNCYGVKPVEGTEKVARFNTAKWSRHD
jgi:hypothetical protein